MTYRLPFLYGIDKKGKERVWKIWSKKNVIYTTYGEVGGKMNPVVERSFGILNEGKKNQVVPEEHAKAEAERKWIKQLNKGYHPHTRKGKELEARITSAQRAQGNTTHGISTLVRGEKAKPKGGGGGHHNFTVSGFETKLKPMQCQTWSMESKVLKYFDFDQGVYLQPKLDGVRALVHLYNDRIAITSRSSKQLTWLEDLRVELKRFLKGEDVVLDGELYAHELYGSFVKKGKNYTYAEGDEMLPDDLRFAVISGIGRPVRGTPHPLENQLELWVFDLVDTKLTQDERFAKLDELFARKIAKKCPHIKFVPTHKVSSIEKIDRYLEKFNTFEGVVVRSASLMYESGRRSLKIRKYKKFTDKEFTIVGTSHKEGTTKDTFCWVCELEDGETFNVKPMGTREQRLQWYKDRKQFIGSDLTVKYQEVSANGIPRFPVGRPRDD